MLGKQPSNGSGRDRRLEEQLKELEAKAQSASEGYDAQAYARAGEACVAGNQPERGIRYYGRAIDAYLRAGRARAAAVLCRRIIGLDPEVVRARRTLTILSIADGDTGRALEYLDDYVRAAATRGDERLAIKHLRMMAEASNDTSFLERLSEHLRQLGSPQLAAQVDELAGQPAPETKFESESERWTKVLQIALRDPD